jgi:GNAT superfamily N-acetyltransferase
MTICSVPLPNARTARSGQISIRAAANVDELEQLYRFRYRIYVDEMARKQKYADHRAKRIEDPLDSFATNLIAWDAAGSVVGTVRTNFSRDGDLNGYDAFYDMDTCSAHPGTTSICTRMMVAPAHRRSGLAVQLSVAAYEYGLVRGITHNFMDCNAHLVRFYQGMGFVQHLPQREHPEYGVVTVMRLDVRDRAHLQAVHSPFLALLDRTAEFAQRHLPGALRSQSAVARCANQMRQTP